MKPLLLASLLLTQTGPNWMNGDPEAVPNPIPPDICIEAHVTEKGRQAGGEGKIQIFNVPQSTKDIHFLEEARKRGLAVLKRCSSADS